jgi:hypothetical protein
MCAARALRPSLFDNLAKSAEEARAFTKGSHLGPAAAKAPALFSNKKMGTPYDSLSRLRRLLDCNGRNSTHTIGSITLIVIAVSESMLGFRRPAMPCLFVQSSLSLRSVRKLLPASILAWHRLLALPIWINSSLIYTHFWMS